MIVARGGLRIMSAGLAALLGLASAAHAADQKPPPPPPTPAQSDGVDAELLRDLEVLNNPDYARDREIAKRMSLYDRLRALEAMRGDNNQQPVTGATQPVRPGSGR